MKRKIKYLTEKKIMKMLGKSDIYEYRPHKFRGWNFQEFRIRKKKR